MGVTILYGNDFDTSESSKLFKYSVDVYAELSSLVDVVEGDLSFVSTTTGIFGFRDLKGLYEFKGGLWVYATKDLQDLAITQQAEITSNDQDIQDLQDEKADKTELATYTPLGNYIGTAEDLKNDINRLTWGAFIDSELPLMNQQSRPNYEPYFGVRESIVNVDNTGTWVLLLPYTGDYEIELNYRFSLNDNRSNFEAHLLLDGSVFSMPLHIEPKNAGGSGQVVPIVANDVLTGGSANTGTDQFIKTSGKRFITRTAGDSVSMRLEFAGQNADKEAAIYNATLTVRHFDNKNTPTVPPSIGTATISYNSFFGGFSGTVSITNNSGANINSWDVIISGTNWTPTSSGSSSFVDLGNDNWLFQNAGFNGTILDGQTLNFLFQGTTGETGQNNPINGILTVSGS
jgi:hypothetical protein